MLKSAGRPNKNSARTPPSSTVSAESLPGATKVDLPKVDGSIPASFDAMVVRGVTPTEAPAVAEGIAEIRLAVEGKLASAFVFSS